MFIKNNLSTLVHKYAAPIVLLSIGSFVTSTNILCVFVLGSILHATNKLYYPNCLINK